MSWLLWPFFTYLAESHLVGGTPDRPGDMEHVQSWSRRIAAPGDMHTCLKLHPQAAWRVSDSFRCMLPSWYLHFPTSLFYWQYWCVSINCRVALLSWAGNVLGWCRWAFCACIQSAGWGCFVNLMADQSPCSLHPSSIQLNPPYIFNASGQYVAYVTKDGSQCRYQSYRADKPSR